MITGEEMLEELIKIEPSRLDENTQKLFYTIMKVIDERDELQKRIEKAIEYIEYNDETLYTYEPDYDYEENIVSNYDVSSFREDLLEILKGKSND